MTATTTIQGLPYRVGTDAPDLAAATLALAQAVETKLVMVYASATDRSSKVTSPTEGMLGWLQDVNAYDYHNGSIWVRTALGARVGCRLRRAAAQSIANNTITPISWDTEDEDTNSFITVTGSTITIPAGYGGLYALSLRVNHQAIETTFHSSRNYCEITPSSSNIPPFRQKIDSVEDQTAIAVVTPLAAADTIQCNMFQDSGSAQNLAAAWFTAYRIGA
jgi:hypothetical protein